MLQNIDPLLTGELLRELDHMGHGDTLVVADANFPAHRLGTAVIEAPGVSAPRMLAAIATVFPFDAYDGAAMLLMSTAGDPRHDAGELPEVQRELLAAAGVDHDALERFAFYEAAASARLVVRTGEGRPYGNALLRKGVVTA